MPVVQVSILMIIKEATVDKNFMKFIMMFMLQRCQQRYFHQDFMLKWVTRSTNPLKKQTLNRCTMYQATDATQQSTNRLRWLTSNNKEKMNNMVKRIWYIRMKGSDREEFWWWEKRRKWNDQKIVKKDPYSEGDRLQRIEIRELHRATGLKRRSNWGRKSMRRIRWSFSYKKNWPTNRDNTRPR